MAKTTIRVFRAGEDDWVVQEEGGRELGHYPTKASAKPWAAQSLGSGAPC
jgi:hypothetical protein